MGFDISGVNPKMHTKKDEFPLLKKYHWDNYKTFQERDDAMSDSGEKEAYWEQYDAELKANPGIYFRNNVWWWRPLWRFVCENCEDILSEEDIEGGCWNNNHKINGIKARNIGKRLQMLIEDKTVENYESAYEEFRKEKAESDDKDESFMGNYPFCQDNIARFAKFCKESGGFVIN